MTVFPLQLEKKEEKISRLIQKLSKLEKTEEKILFLQREEEVVLFFQEGFVYEEEFVSFSKSHRYLFLLLVLLEQKTLLGARPWFDPSFFSALEEIEDFYSPIGGILGYQKMVLELLQKEKKEKFSSCEFFPPPYFDISFLNETVSQYVTWGIESLPFMAEIYPLGGAADRLHLQDEKTKEELPAAKLFFSGKTLLEHLILDLKAREFLYFQKYKKQIITPLVLMTSEEKKNTEHIEAILEENNWFGRPKESLFWLKQPLVPAVDEKGTWMQKESGALLLKPSGHGALWKLMWQKGVFTWLKKQNKKKAIIRQINNPIAGLDYGILAFLGLGYHFDMHFGFASCLKEKKVAEGLDILVERKKTAGAFEYFITNIEYCQWQRFSLQQENAFLANTNLLFADLQQVEEATRRNPFPGLLLNLKEHTTLEGRKKVGRLETTMQNISDEIIERVDGRRSPPKMNKTYVTYNKRNKTISTTKKVYEKGNFSETPEKCFYDFYQNHHELLQNFCQMQLPPLRDFEEVLQKGPAFFLEYGPHLGPLYTTIAEKIIRGKMEISSYFSCNLADLLFKEVELKGACLLRADEPLGKVEEGVLHYRKRRSKCVFNQVCIENEGVDLSQSKPFWKGSPFCKSSLTVRLKPGALFVAEKVTLKGTYDFSVGEEEACFVFEKQGKVLVEKRKRD